MAIIKPFRALRPHNEYAKEVASRPYDVLNSEEARKEAQGNLVSFLHVTKSEIDLPLDTDIHSQQVYDKAKENLQALIEKKVLFQDDEPCYYIYELAWKGRTQTGLVCVSSVQDYFDGVIKKHEFTRPEKTNALLNEAGLTAIDSIYNKTPEELAALLKVDAVIMTTLERDKNFSDGVAYGLAAGRAVLNVLSRTPTVGAPLNQNSSDINMNAYLYDGKDGRMLWKTFRKGGTDLPSDVNGLVEYYSNWIAKKLPYRS